MDFFGFHVENKAALLILGLVALICRRAYGLFSHFGSLIRRYDGWLVAGRKAEYQREAEEKR